MTLKERIEEFDARYGKEAEEFFSQHPRVLSWGASGLDDVGLTLKAPKFFKSAKGRLILDEDGHICRFESNDGKVVLKRPKPLSDEMLVAQITGLLADSEDASRYCEQVSSTLLEDGECVFNVPYGLHMRDKEYSERYHSQKWQDAWVSALMSEFQAKDVTADEKAGIGCFHLRAI